MKIHFFCFLLYIWVVFASRADLNPADLRRESAVAAFLSERPQVPSPHDKLLVVRVDFNQHGDAAFLLCYSVTDYFKHVGHTWTVLEFKNGAWVEPKTLDENGVTKNTSAISFDEDNADLVRLDKYGRYGILSYSYKQWWFTYLENDVLRTIRFAKASDIGMSEMELKRLADSRKISVERRGLSSSR
ncbi:hypothetical protein CfE428DRAFT_4851 [Chthoniobacter flavus Ellin428]|uniref:Uncharacterized protein n=1 Tax=Chthoniobacter flavus Ellin428 TaxID=497964 RepID=B4D7D6_9BACT|nr:hypothetical protein [Chthoniobacter flavus]EDY17553.1 hypothetical protein CfE428DRAFT_4851 [Chthoniobacter flavus Ellin428]TCO92415.1 hypothetical protein EV701_106184 [Chthoniobacter flavus]